MSECIIARQPIFDINLKIYGYELLFRRISTNASADFDPEEATSSVLVNGMFVIGLEELTKGKLAFVNFSRKMLINDVMTFLPNKDIAIEILETVEPDEECLSACTKLKEAGYKIVLDDFVYHPKFDSFIAIADIIKVDFLLNSAAECEALPRRFANRTDLIFLAEKVETYDQYMQGKKWGYSLFQGYFFCKPVVLNTRDIQGNKLIYVELLKELNNPLVSFDQLEQIIQRDVALSYKVLKYVNSAALGIRTKINSVKQALAMLGRKNMEKFITLVLLKGLSGDKPSELITTSLIRGRFAELVAYHLNLKEQTSTAFLVGMFSLVEALLDQSMEKVLSDLSLSDDISTALRRQPSVLTFILEMVIAYEQGDGGTYEIYCRVLGIKSEDVKKMYLDAVSWVTNIEEE
ncbi:MAG: HDOD domain-containing protein [Sporomusaceae bacterium]|nr:HDOD domain-containing protein [Sporomusaceae bacterium]